jgi:hypothetical protein
MVANDTAKGAKLSFHVGDNEGIVRTDSEAYLSEDGSELSGTSVELITEPGKPIKRGEYTLTARRIQAKPWVATVNTITTPAEPSRSQTMNLGLPERRGADWRLKTTII